MPVQYRTEQKRKEQNSSPERTERKRSPCGKPAFQPGFQQSYPQKLWKSCKQDEEVSEIGLPSSDLVLSLLRMESSDERQLRGREDRPAGPRDREGLLPDLLRRRRRLAALHGRTVDHAVLRKKRGRIGSIFQFYGRFSGRSGFTLGAEESGRYASLSKREVPSAHTGRRDRIPSSRSDTNNVPPADLNPIPQSASLTAPLSKGSQYYVQPPPAGGRLLRFPPRHPPQSPRLSS